MIALRGDADAGPKVLAAGRRAGAAAFSPTHPNNTFSVIAHKTFTRTRRDHGRVTRHAFARWRPIARFIVIMD